MGAWKDGGVGGKGLRGRERRQRGTGSPVNATLTHPLSPRFGAVACGVAMELYVFGGVRSREDIQGGEMVTCKSEFYHDEFKR